MSAPVWKWDVTSESTGTELVLTADPWFLLEQSFPMPDLDTQFSSSVDATRDTLTSLRYKNRKITLKMRVVGSSAGALETQVSYAMQKAAKTNADAVTTGTGIGATLQYTSPSGDAVVFDVVHASVVADTGKRYAARDITEVVCEFECLPFWRGAENTPSDHTETTLPVLTFTEATVDGDVPALGRLVVDEDQAASQAWVMAALRSKNYSSDADAALFYQAEGRTPLGGSAATASSGYSGTASGSGSNVVDVDNLATDWEAVLSTQATGGGSHLQHVGSYRVFVRVQADSSNTGIVGVAFEWGVGDFRNPARNTPVYLTDTRASDGTAVEDQWILADLGLVTIPQVQVGTQYWEGRVIAKSSALSDQLFIDHLIFAPVDEFYAEASKGTVGAAATAYTAFDDFSAGTYSGDLASDTLPTGGTWGTTASPYETSDFAVTGGVARRTAVSDTVTDIRYGRIMYPSGTASMTNTAAHLEFTAVTTANLVRGVAARIVDKDNMLVAVVESYGSGTSDGFLIVQKVVAGTPTTLTTRSVTLSHGGPIEIDAKITAGGEWSFTAALGSGTFTLTGQDSALATGGALASGSCGVVDWAPTATAATRDYQTFYCYVPVVDAAVFAGQSIQFRHDGCLREDSAGGYWQRVSRYEGDYLLVPPSGREARTVEVIVKACRNDPRTGADSALDDVSAQLFISPRGLQLPS